VKIETGTPEDHPTPLPIDDSATPGVQRLTAIQPGQLSGPTYDARDTTGEFQEQMHADAAMVAAAQSSGETAEHDRRAGYQAQALPLGGHIGDGMTMPPSPLDPGVGSLGSGETLPAGAFYDAPREGAPETYLANTGDQPQNYP
jgi:hypothetical protein